MNYAERFAIEQADPEHMRKVLENLLEASYGGYYLDPTGFWQMFEDTA